MFENYKDWAISSRASSTGEEGSTTIPPGSRINHPKYGLPNLSIKYGKDIV
jgi:hypothetical protein